MNEYAWLSFREWLRPRPIDYVLFPRVGWNLFPDVTSLIYLNPMEDKELR